MQLLDTPIYHCHEKLTASSPTHRRKPNDIKFEIDFKQFFKYYKVLNAKFLAEKIGMNATLLSQYIQGHKKPSAKQTEKILCGIHQIGQELSEINLLQTAYKE